MRFVYMITKGAGDPTGVSIPLHLAANGSLEVGHEVTVLFAGDGTEVFVGDNASRIEGVGVPPMRELLAKLKDRDATVFVWRGCAVARGVTEEALASVNGAWTTPPEAATLCAEADRVLTF